MTSDAKRRHPLPKGLRLNADGSARVRMARFTGQPRSAAATFPDVASALVAYEVATAARKKGEDAGTALKSESERAWRERSVANVPPALRPKTISQLCDSFLEARQKLMENSDHSRRANKHNGVLSLRPGTVRIDRNHVEKRLRPSLGTMLGRDVTSAVLQDWIYAMADEGLAPEFQEQLLIKLRLVMKRARNDQPSEYPWSDVLPVAPAERRKAAPDPSQWGGTPGDRDPVLVFKTAIEIASSMRAADRVVVFVMALAGLRRGEVYGLDLGHLTFDDDGLLWIRISQMRDLLDGTVSAWVKTDASYRRIAIAPTLARYLVSYCARYHGIDLRQLSDDDRDSPLVVNPSGRARDGSWLPGHPGNWEQRWIAARARHGYDRETCGYWLDPHHLRKSFSTYMLAADRILSDIRVVGPQVFGGDVSSYLGHDYKSSWVTLPASPITTGFYNLGSPRESGSRAIAAATDLIIQHELDGSKDLDASPDDLDLLPVVTPEDDDWIDSRAAAALAGVSRTRITAAVKSGTLDGHPAWIADGGWTRQDLTVKTPPATPVIVLSRKSLASYIEFRENPSMREAGKILGVTDSIARKLGEAGALEITYSPGRQTSIPRSQVELLLEQTLEAVRVCLERGGPLTARELRAHLDWSDLLGGVVERPQTRWCASWLDQLVALRRAVRRSNGRTAVLDDLDACQGGPTASP